MAETATAAVAPRRGRRRWKVVAIAVLVIALDIPVGLRLAASKPIYLAVSWNGHVPARMPSDITLSGDSTFFLNKMSWSVWDSTHAVGEGIGTINNCMPDCATGGSESSQIRITLSHPQRVCGRAFFTRVDVAWPSQKPPDANSGIWMDSAPDCSWPNPPWIW